MTHLTRRTALASLSSLLVPATVWAKPAPGTPAWTDSYLVEAGGGGNGRYVIGLLTCSNPATHIRALEAARVKTGFRRQFCYHSSDKRKLPYANAAFAYFASQKDMTLTVVTGFPFDRETLFRRLQAQTKKDGARQSRVERSGTAKPLGALGRRSTTPGDTHLLDLASVLLGVTRGELSPSTNATKIALRTQLRKALKTPKVGSGGKITMLT